MKGHGLPVYHERERRHRVSVENLLSVMFVEKEAEGESGAIKCPTARQTRMTRPQSSRGTFVEIKCCHGRESAAPDRPRGAGRRAMKSEIGRKGVYERDVEPKKGHLEPKPQVSPQNTLKHHQMNVEER